VSLRIRLTLLYSLLFAAVITVFGIIVYTRTSARLYSSVDDSLFVRARQITSGRAIQLNQSVLNEVAAPGVYAELLSADGTVMASSNNLSSTLPLNTRTRNLTGPVLETHETANDERVRILYQPLDNGDRLLVARSLHQTDAALDLIRILLIGGGIVALVIANGLAYLFSGPALQPIRTATDTAGEIEATGDFSRRIEGEGQRGEVGDLVRTLNELIAKVESTLNAHRAFLADSSHELRRPLAVVRGNLEVLRSGGLPIDDRDLVIGETESEARRMSRILADLLLLSQVDARLILQRQTVDLGDIARSVAEHEQQRFRERRIDVSVPDTPVRVEADEQRVSQVFENLIDNAALYSDAGGPIGISVRANGRHAIAEVRDEGPGMTDDEARHAFERFYRGREGRKRHSDGSGLGLAIVRHIAEAHGGSVALTTSRTGTLVRVELPLLNS
jgi:two-component system OmpR family sensor kinase